MSYSDPYINAIFLACRKTSKSLIRDFGEVEKLQVSLKGVSDFVSLADTKAEKMLIKELTYSYPKINIIAEETGVIKNSDENIRWIIDPLDGTSNFVFSIPHFAISIALEKNNEVIVGGVYQPLTDEFFWAVKGRGAYCNNLRLRVSSKENLEDCMIGTGIPHKGMKGHEEYVPGLKQVMEKVCGIRRFGAASLDLAYVAAGKFDGYWEKNLKLVDIAANCGAHFLKLQTFKAETMTLKMKTGKFVIKNKWGQLDILCFYSHYQTLINRQFLLPPIIIFQSLTVLKFLNKF